ncbi:MAG: hypothetical protein ACHQK8_06400 [Bacteroidia bacterium]
MEVFEKISNERLLQMVEQVVGGNWQVSLLTEFQTNTSADYEEWDLHLDEITDGQLTDHLHKRFTLFYFWDRPVESQLMTILKVIKKGIAQKDWVADLNGYEIAQRV